MKHTDGQMGIEYDGSLVLAGEVMQPVVPDESAKGERKANHERISGLWNACEGMSTEEAANVLNDYRKRYYPELIDMSAPDKN